MPAAGRTHRSGSRTLLTAVGLGTAAVAGAAIALAVTTPPSSRSRRLARRHRGAQIRSFPPSSDAVDQDGSGLFV